MNIHLNPKLLKTTICLFAKLYNILFVYLGQSVYVCVCVGGGERGMEPWTYWWNTMNYMDRSRPIQKSG